MTDQAESTGVGTATGADATNGTPPTTPGSGPTVPPTPDQAVKAVEESLGTSDGDERRHEREAGRRLVDRRSGGNYIYAHQVTVLGDMIGRDKGDKTSSRDRRRAAEVDVANHVSEDLLAKVRAVFTPAPFFTRASTVLLASGLVVLHGSTGLGKATAAIRLLLARGAVPLDVNPCVSIDQLMALEFEHSAAYLVDGLTADTASRLSAFVLKQLESRLRDAEAQLVLTVDRRVTLAASDLVTWLVVCDRVTDISGMLDRHLDWYLSGPDPVPARHRARAIDGVDALVAQRLSPAQVDRLAQLLAQALRGEMDEAEAVKRFETSAQAEVEDWFGKEGRSLADCALMISVAVLGGARYQAVVEAANRLYRLLITAERLHQPATIAVASAQTETVLFSTTTARRLRTVGACLVETLDTTDVGSSPVDLVEFENQSWHIAVLRHVWDEQDLVRRVLLDWLRALCTEPSVDVRVGAATALGKLSEYDFGYVWREVLVIWATDEDARVRAAVAFALGMPACQDALAPQVLRLLFRWAGHADWRLQWTAATAFGRYWVGLRFPAACLLGLESVARAEDTRLLIAVASSVTELFRLADESPDYPARVLEALERWTRPGDDSRFVRLGGLLAFQKLAAEVDSTARTELGRPWPALLELIDSEAPGAALAVDLWRRCLRTKFTRQLALDCLRAWAQQGDSDPELYAAVERLVLTLADGEDGRDRDRLRFHVDRWVSKSDGGETAPGRLLQALSENRE